MTTTESPAPTEHARQRRDDLLHSAARVFARRGFERATTKEIAAEAGVSEGTIYNYFASKDELLLQLVALMREQMGTVVPDPQSHADVRQSVADAVERFFNVVAENTVVIRGLLSALAHRSNASHGYLLPGAERLLGRVEAFLRTSVQSGAIPPCDVHLAARMTVGMVLYTALPYVQEIEPMPSPIQRRRQAQAMVGILFDGLLGRAEV
jgi:AcrR family transcriptional regulator